MLKIVYACVFLALSLGIIESGGEKLEDRWEECPANLSAYVGCQFTVHALFRSVNHSCVIGTDYSYTIRVNNLAFGDVNVKRVNGSERLCNISVTFDVKKVDHDVHFLAARIPPDPDVSSIKCKDILDVHNSVPSPNISNITLNCDGSIIEWTAPELVDGSAVNQYKLQIDGPNITYQITNATSVLVPYDDLLYNEEYTISIYAIHCGREGNRTFGTMKTATEVTKNWELYIIRSLSDYGYVVGRYHGTHGNIRWGETQVPQVLNHIKTDMEIKNLSHAIVTFITKVITPGCLVSYPTIVAMDILCVPEEKHVLVDNKMVNVTDDGSIVLELEFPIDKDCFGTLVWKNRYFNSNRISADFDTNQLRLCTFAVDEDQIVFSCEYANGSTLQGCTVIATDLSNGRQYNMNSSRASGRERGVISGLCDGVYSVTCEGALAPTGIIRYSGTQYSTVLSLTSVSDCKGTSLTPLSLTTIQSVSVTPPTAAVRSGKSDRLMIIIIAVVLPIVLLLIGIVITAVAICIVVYWKNRKKNSYSLSDSNGTPINGNTTPKDEIRTKKDEDTNSKQTSTLTKPDGHRDSNGMPIDGCTNSKEDVVTTNGIDSEHKFTPATEGTEKNPLGHPSALSQPGGVVLAKHTEDGDDEGYIEVLPVQEARVEGEIAKPKHKPEQHFIKPEIETLSSKGRRASEKVVSTVVKFHARRSTSLTGQELLSMPKPVTKEPDKKPLLENSTSEAPEPSVHPPGEELPTNPGFVRKRNPSIPSPLSSLVSGIVSQANPLKPLHASDSENKHLISNTSESHQTMEDHPPETEHTGIIVVGKPKTSYSEVPEKSEEKDSVQTSDHTHDPASSKKPDILMDRHSYSTSAASSEVNDVDDQDKRDDTEHKEVIQVPRLDCEQKTMIHDDRKQMSDEFSIPKSESQYSVHQPHEEEGSHEDKTYYTLIPQQAGKKR